MGVDTKILLPPYVTLDDAARVIGIAAGLPWHKMPIGGYDDSWAPRVDGLFINSCDGVPSMARIVLRFTDGRYFVDGGEVHATFYHFEGSRLGERLLMPPAWPLWQAIGKRLVEFFGGRLDLWDCDDKDDDLVVAPRYPLGLPDDGKPWRKLQEDIAAVKPVTKEELDDLRALRE